MKYIVCDAREVDSGHLILFDRNGAVTPAITVATGQHRHLLILPKKQADSQVDFRLFDLSNAPHHRFAKVLDLGMNFIFEFSPMSILLDVAKVDLGLGSMILSGTTQALVGRMGQQGLDETVMVGVEHGQLCSVPSRNEAAEIKAWRLLLPSDIPLSPPQEVARWPTT